MQFTRTMEIAKTIDSLLAKKKTLSEEEKLEIEVYAVAMGANVTCSSYWQNENGSHVQYFLDQTGIPGQCWQARKSQKGEWIQVSCQNPKLWTGLILQGREDMDQWITSLKIMHTMRGKVWSYVEDGKQYPACSDRNTKVKIAFKEPVYGRTLRLYPQTWHNSISLRFEAIYLDLE